MKLYFAPGACSLAPHIALHEAGLPFTVERVDLRAKKTASGADYLAINPKGAVPALALDDGETLTEVAALLQYIADRAGGPLALPPVGSKERYRLLEWLNFVATELHKGFGPLWKPNTPDAYKPIVRENLAQRFAHLDDALAGKPYLLGDQPTVADAYLFTILNWSNFHQIDLAPYPNVAAFMQRMAARPAVRKAMQAEGLVKAA